MIKFMEEAIRLAQEKMLEECAEPFGAVVVKNGEIIGQGYSQVSLLKDPTAHAEIMAIRQACSDLDTFDLSGCALYTSCEPCPMCLGAIYWARISHIYYSNTRKDAASIGFSSDFIYRELTLPLVARKIPMVQMMRGQALDVFRQWRKKCDRVEY